METNAVLHMTTDDPAAIIDVPHFCNEAGHELLKQEKEGDQTIFIIRKVN
jgi:tRNA 2-thiouridine synthesizing protein A